MGYCYATYYFSCGMGMEGRVKEEVEELTLKTFQKYYMEIYPPLYNDLLYKEGEIPLKALEVDQKSKCPLGVTFLFCLKKCKSKER